MNTLTLSWKNLINKPLSMTLSLILFALGVGLISLLLILNKQLQDKFDKNLAGIDLVIGAKGSPLQLILCSMYHIDSPTGNITIREAKPFMNTKHPLIKTAIPLSLGDSHEGYRIVGTTHDFLGLYEAQIGEGTLWEADFEVTVGAGVAAALGLKLGDKFQSSHGFVLDDNLIHEDASGFKVVGIIQPTGSVIDQLILTSTPSIWKVHEHNGQEEHEHAPSDSLNLEKPWTDELDKQITSLLIQFKARNHLTITMANSINENTDMQAAYPPFELNRLYAMVGVGEEALRILALIIVIVSGLSIFISLFDSLRDRRYELALMRVMGATRLKLFLLIILEGVLLAIIGFAIGIALSHIGMEVLAGYMKSSYRYSFSGFEFLREELYLLFGALAIGILAAIIPAVQASRTDISETLTDS